MMGACAVAGRLVMGFDNVDKPFGGAPIDKYLAAIDTVDVRILGRTEMPIMRWRGIMLASGNNFHIKGDTFRRVVKGTIETTEENPETRTGFKHYPLLPWVLQERPRLVRAALTVLRAYVLAVASGYPPADIQPMGGFETWANLVVQAIIFAGGQNVLLARPTKDSSRGIAHTLLEGWGRLSKSYTDGVTSREAITLLYPGGLRPSLESDGKGSFDNLREAIEMVTNSSADHLPHPKKLSEALRKFKGRLFGGMRLMGLEDGEGITRWRVERVTVIESAP
jgi:hypothetical protein